MRIAIITFHRAYNCGAMLQAWALRTVLERMGHRVSFPYGSFCSVGPSHPVRLPIYDRCRKGSIFKQIRSFAYRLLLTALGKKSGITAGVYYESFRRSHLPETQCKIEDFSHLFDVVVLGSDQVLNPEIRGWSPYYMGRGIPEKCRKIAYAASIGEKPLSAHATSETINELSTFAAISVREPFQGFPVVLDPSLLLDVEAYKSIAKPIRRRRDYLYMYSIETTDFELATAKEIATRLGLDLIVTPLHGTFNRTKNRVISNKISPSYLVGYVRNAKYVLAGSFHGTAVALVHRKPFLNVVPDQRTTKRVSALLDSIGESDRIVNPDITVNEMVRRLTRPFGDTCFARLEQIRQASLDWLENALENVGK